MRMKSPRILIPRPDMLDCEPTPTRQGSPFEGHPDPFKIWYLYAKDFASGTAYMAACEIRLSTESESFGYWWNGTSGPIESITWELAKDRYANGDSLIRFDTPEDLMWRTPCNGFNNKWDELRRYTGSCPPRLLTLDEQKAFMERLEREEPQLDGRMDDFYVNMLREQSGADNLLYRYRKVLGRARIECDNGREPDGQMTSLVQIFRKK